MFDWIYQNETLLLWLMAASVLSFVASLVMVPWILTRIPADYFTASARHRRVVKNSHILSRIVLLVLKNCFGLIFLIAGIIMLALPGQGLLTILVGLTLLNFPGKYRLETRVVGHHLVLPGINWIREKAGKAPLILEEKD